MTAINWECWVMAVIGAGLGYVAAYWWQGRQKK